MITIPNPGNATLEEINNRLLGLYPKSEIKKPWLGPAYLKIPVDNYKLILRYQKRKQRFLVDSLPPLLWSIAGMIGFSVVLSFIVTALIGRPTAAIGGASVAIGFLIIKAIFNNKKKAELERFKQDVTRALLPDENSIF